jgi:GNAT superfamily N-acetyltransferase
LPFDLTDPGVWVLGSVVVAAVATNLAWLARRALRGSGGSAGALVEPLRWLAVALFFALPPILAWRSGALSPYLMGLAEIDWARSLTSGVILMLVSAGIVLAAWAVGLRTARMQPEGRPPLWRAPLDAALLQWHWSFYRAGLAGWLLLADGGASFADRMPLPDLAAPVARALAAQVLATDAFYWGSWLGMALVAAEWALSPFARRSALRPYTLLRVALAVVTTAVFVATRNFWLALALHIGVEILAGLWQPTLHPEPTLAAPSPPNNRSQ